MVPSISYLTTLQKSKQLIHSPEGLSGEAGVTASKTGCECSSVIEPSSAGLQRTLWDASEGFQPSKLEQGSSACAGEDGNIFHDEPEEQLPGAKPSFPGRESDWGAAHEEERDDGVANLFALLDALESGDARVFPRRALRVYCAEEDSSSLACREGDGGADMPELDAPEPDWMERLDALEGGLRMATGPTLAIPGSFCAA